MLVFLLATAAAQETPIGRYLAYQQRALDDISKTCAYKHFLLKHDQNCAGVTDRPAPYAPLAAARHRLRYARGTMRLSARSVSITPSTLTAPRQRWSAARCGVLVSIRSASRTATTVSPGGARGRGAHDN